MFLNIQRWSLHDGPGIRTTVFFKGCPLRCRWCSNPESWDFEKQLLIFKNRCTSCGTCVDVCPEKAVIRKDGNIKYDSDQCALCGRCIKSCPEGARELAGLDLSGGDVLKIVERDSVFYQTSGGGITFSGGEPFSQIDLLSTLVKKCAYLGIHTSVETSGYFSMDKAAKTLEKMNHITIDIKHVDDCIHKNLTGVSNRKIIQNIIDVDRAGKNITLRIPLVKNLTDTDVNIKGIVKIAKQLEHLTCIELMTYHELGIFKYDGLGIGYDSSMVPSDKTNDIAKYIKSFGIKCL